MALFLTPAERSRTLPGALPTLAIRQRHLIGRIDQGVVVLAVTAPQLLEDVVADGFGQELLLSVAQLGAYDVVLDLHAVHAVSSAAIRAMDQLRDMMQGRGRRLVLSGVCPSVAEAIHLAHEVEAESALDLFLLVQPDIATAIAWLNGSHVFRSG